MNSKMISRAAGLVMLAGLVAPSMAAAQPAGNRPRQDRVRAQAADDAMGRQNQMAGRNVCTMFENQAGVAIQERIGKRANDINEHRASQQVALAERRSARDTKMSERRETADERREARESRIMGWATTDELKAAVTAFNGKVEAATTKYRAALDAANAAHRDGVNEAVDSRKEAIDAIKSKYDAAVEAARAAAKTACTVEGADTAAIRETMTAAIAAARAEATSDMKEIENVGENLKALNEARNTAVKTALDELKTTISAARDELKKIFEASKPADAEKTEDTEEETE